MAVKSAGRLAGGILLVLVSALAVRAQESRLDQMVQAALLGPEVKALKYLKHEFNVKKAKITDRVTGITKIEGQISHYRLFRPDEQFYYSIEKKDGKITKAEFRIERDDIAPYAGKLGGHLPVMGIAQDEIAAAVSKLGQKLDGSWEAEAELIAYSIALRVDPMSHKDLATMFKQGNKVNLVGAGNGAVVSGISRSGAPKQTAGNVVVRDHRQK
jgi:hypothetical protein